MRGVTVSRRSTCNVRCSRWIPDTRIGFHASELVSRSKLLRQWGVTRQLRPCVQKKFYDVVEPERVWREYTAFCRQSRSDKSKSGKPCLLLREGVKLALNVPVTPRERKPVYSRATRFGSIGCARRLNVDSTAWMRSPRMAFCPGAGSPLTSRRIGGHQGRLSVSNRSSQLHAP